MSVLRWVWVGAFCTLTGCVSLSGIERAETLGLGRSEIAFSGAATGGVPTSGNGSAQFYPRFDLAARTGVSDGVNIGGQFGTIIANSNGTNVLGLDVQIGLKAMLTDRSAPFVISLAPSTGAAFVAGGVTAQAFEWNATLPLLMGLRIGPHELVFGPRIANVLEVATGQGGGTIEIFGIGGSVGFAAQLTPNIGIMPEVAFNVPVTGQINAGSLGSGSLTFNGFFLTFGVGFLFDWGSSGHEFEPAHTDQPNPSNLF